MQLADVFITQKLAPQMLALEGPDTLLTAGCAQEFAIKGCIPVPVEPPPGECIVEGLPVRLLRFSQRTVYVEDKRLHGILTRASGDLKRLAGSIADGSDIRTIRGRVLH